jgi:hypothetical protein
VEHITLRAWILTKLREHGGCVELDKLVEMYAAEFGKAPRAARRAIKPRLRFMEKRGRGHVHVPAAQRRVPERQGSARGGARKVHEGR